MASTVASSKKRKAPRKAAKAVLMSKAEMVRKMLADQQAIREAIQNGIDLKELKNTHGLSFAPLPTIKH
jgi:hypothetical protein